MYVAHSTAKKTEDFVIATGVQHRVREFCYHAFKRVGLTLEFTGVGMDEKGIDKETEKNSLSLAQTSIALPTL